jgi:hypothetical protein
MDKWFFQRYESETHLYTKIISRYAKILGIKKAG